MFKIIGSEITDIVFYIYISECHRILLSKKIFRFFFFLINKLGFYYRIEYVTETLKLLDEFWRKCFVTIISSESVYVYRMLWNHKLDFHWLFYFISDLHIAESYYTSMRIDTCLLLLLFSVYDQSNYDIKGEVHLKKRCEMNNKLIEIKIFLQNRTFSYLSLFLLKSALVNCVLAVHKTFLFHF